MNKLIILPIGDFVLSVSALYFAYTLRFGLTPAKMDILSLSGSKILAFAFVVIFLSFMFNMYSQERNDGRKEVLIRIIGEISMALLALSALYYMDPAILLGRGVLMLSLMLFGLFQFFWHTSYTVIRLQGLSRKVLILGSGSLAQRMGDIIKEKNNPYVFSGHISVPHEQLYLPTCTPASGNGHSDGNGGGSGNGNGNEKECIYALEDIVKQEKAHRIVVSLSERRGVFPVKEVLNCKLKGIDVVDAPTFYEEMTGKLLIEEITPSWFIFSDGFKITPFKRSLKRVLDIFTACVGLTMLLPVLPVVALAIKISSRGPVFFKQSRIGEGEKPFTLYKFRTMLNDAEKGIGAVWAQEKDPRVTKVGKLLRQTRLDEFPQFYNVLKGDMSIVGPRPERPEFVEKLKRQIPYYSERHTIRPGITGWAQICYPYGSSVNDAIEKLRYDLYYVKHLSIFLDIMVIIETIKVMLFGRGAR
jgi:sugar transferase (PEP-CTERM system associated)